MITELKDTVELMNSEDYKERFKAEYLQTKIRYEKLQKITAKGLPVLNDQKRYMAEYLRCLEIRAEIEGITLE